MDEKQLRQIFNKFHVRPIAWACRTCGKVSWVDVPEYDASPEHVSYRGVDLGSCKGEMIPLYESPDFHDYDKNVLTRTDSTS